VCRIILEIACCCRISRMESNQYDLGHAKALVREGYRIVASEKA